MAIDALIRTSHPSATVRATVTVPSGCRDHMIPLTDPRAGTLTRAGVGMVALSGLRAGYDWPGPDPLTHLVLVTLGGRGVLEVDGQRHELLRGSVAVAPAHRPRRHRTAVSWRVVTVRLGDVPAWQTFHETGPFVLQGDDVRRFEAPIVGILAELPARVTTAAEVSAASLTPIEHLTTRFPGGMNWELGQDGRPVPADPFSLYASVLRIQLESLRDARRREADLPAALAALWDRVRHEPAADWSMARLCERLHVSRATLHRLVARHHGSSPGAIVERIRMDEAAHLLAHGNLPVHVIAGRVGYATACSFSAAFRRTFGTPPARFRDEVTLQQECPES